MKSCLLYFKLTFPFLICPEMQKVEGCRQARQIGRQAGQEGPDEMPQQLGDDKQFLLMIKHKGGEITSPLLQGD